MTKIAAYILINLIWLFISNYEVQAVPQYEANIMTASNILHPGG